MLEQLPDRDLRALGNDARQVPREAVVEPESVLIDELHDERSGERIGHAADQESLVCAWMALPGGRDRAVAAVRHENDVARQVVSWW